MPRLFTPSPADLTQMINAAMAKCDRSLERHRVARASLFMAGDVPQVLCDCASPMNNDQGKCMECGGDILYDSKS